MSTEATVPTTKTLNKKVLGVPVLYLAGGFVAILAVLAWRMKSAPSTPDTAATDTTGAAGSTDTSLISDAGVYPEMPVGTVTTGAVASTPALENASIQDNDEWLKRGVAFLIGRGIPAGEAQLALSTYLSGNQLSSAQGTMRDQTISELGLPPFPPDVVQDQPAPAQAQGTIPRDHIVKGTNDNTPAEIATLYYGRADAFATGAITKAPQNADLPAGQYAVGTPVYVPTLPTPAAVPPAVPPKPVVKPPVIVKPPAPKPTARPWPRVYYRIGSTGNNVKFIQQELNKASFHPNLKVDGIYGSLTKHAVENWQRQHHLTVDGVVGPKTWASLAA
ncbi:MAG TPA: peptidoglycan-binding domain-containing protein [Candidatus Paceibacterota bacterium]|jgi:hypothetical protein